jgi:hypothetical protein
MPMNELFKRVRNVVSRLREAKVESSFVVHGTGGDCFWSNDVTYEVGLLNSAGLLCLQADMIGKTDANYDEAFEFVCKDLEPKVKAKLREVVGKEKLREVVG